MWWLYLVIPLLLLLAIWGFASIVGVETRWLSHKTSRRAEDLYGGYADSKPNRQGLPPKGDASSK